MLHTHLLHLLNLQILLQAEKYGIFDKLHESGKPVAVETLAKSLDVLPHTLERLLNACTALGLLKRSTSGKQGTQNI